MTTISGVMQDYSPQGTKPAYFHQAGGDGFVVQGYIPNNHVDKVVEALAEMGAKAVVVLRDVAEVHLFR